jgi:hypothetical protein
MGEGPSGSAFRSGSQTAPSCCGKEPWWCCVKKTRERHAAREMKGGPSEPSCRRRLQTAMSCFGQKPRWLTSWSKDVGLITSGRDERDERKRTSVEASKRSRMTSKLGSHHCSRKSVAATYLLATRCPVFRRRDSHSGSRTELENLAGDAKGKAQAANPQGRKYRCAGEGRTAP